MDHKDPIHPTHFGISEAQVMEVLEVSVLYLFLEEEFLFYLRLCKGSDWSSGQS